jgi:hypothetical protein
MEIIRSLSPLHSKLVTVSNCVSLLVAKSTLKTNCANKRLLCWDINHASETVRLRLRLHAI